ncbi:MAG: ABC transporter ATP-binding protein [Pseudomonadota bacterium]
MNLLEVEALSKSFPLRGGPLGLRRATLQAVNGVSFALAPGEVLGLVGESGSGKSTLGRCVLRLIEPSNGGVRFDGVEITGLGTADLRRLRRRMQIVFQDPYASLDPRRTVRATLAQARSIHGLDTSDAGLVETLEQVGLGKQHLGRFAHEFSGGQRQRIGIARALAVGPDFIVADEPVSALDVSIQAQIVNLLADLKAELNLAMLFIGHDLAVIEHVSDRVMVLYLGRVMEIAPVAQIYSAPLHPYTRALLSAAPRIGGRIGGRIDGRIGAGIGGRIILRGEQPSPAKPPSGCVFRTRCAHAVPDCAATPPPLTATGPGHLTACIRDDLPIWNGPGA